MNPFLNLLLIAPDLDQSPLPKFAIVPVERLTGFQSPDDRFDSRDDSGIDGLGRIRLIQKRCLAVAFRAVEADRFPLVVFAGRRLPEFAAAPWTSIKRAAAFRFSVERGDPFANCLFKASYFFSVEAIFDSKKPVTNAAL